MASTEASDQENGCLASDSVDGKEKQTEMEGIVDGEPTSNSVDNDCNHLSESDSKNESDAASTISADEKTENSRMNDSVDRNTEDENAEMQNGNDVVEKCLDDEIDGTTKDNSKSLVQHENNGSVLNEVFDKNEGKCNMEKENKDTVEASDEQTESAKDKEHNKTLDLSSGESEFSKFLTEIPPELDGSMIDNDTGIVINDKDIIKAEDVLGRGKRSRTPKTDSIYTSNIDDDDPDYDPSDEQNDRPRKMVKAKQTQQSALETIQKVCTPLKKSKFPHLDVKALELPGEYGWHREIVVRNTYDDHKKRPADVYYKPPSGKKLRSMVEVSTYLRAKNISDLTEKNFSFIKTPISDPPFETVRNAGKPTFCSRKKPQIMIEKDSDEPAVPYTGSPKKSPRGRKRKHSIGISRPTNITPKSTKVSQNEEGKENKGIPFLPEMQLQIKTEPIDPDEENEKEKNKEATFPECPPSVEETRASPSMSPPKKKVKATARKSTTQKAFKPQASVPDGKLDQLCNLNCPGLAGQPPTLQCSVCQCMFHPKCVNVPPTTLAFLCLRCVSTGCSSGSKSISRPNIVNSPKVMTVASAAKSTGTLIPLNTFIANAVSSSFSISPLNSVITVTTASKPIEIKKEPVDYGTVSTQSSGASSSVLGNVRNFLERKADINQNQPSNQHPLLKEGLQKPVQTQASTAVVFSPLLGQCAPIRTTMPLSSVPAPVLFNSLPLITIPGPLVQDFQKPAPTPKLSISSPVSLVQPPRLTAAPVQKPPTPVVSEVNGIKTIDPSQNKQGQLLTLPPVVIKRLNLTQPVSLKINNTHVTVPPSSFLRTAQGLKLFLPKNTFPVNTGETAKLSVTVTNDKTLSLDTGTSDQSGQLPTIVPNSSRTLAEEPRKSKRFKSNIVPTNCFIQCLYGGFDGMMEVLKYLNIRDLFSAASVCKTWRRLVMHPCLWKEVNFRDMKILDWEKAAKYLSRRAVEVLDLRGMIHHGDRSKNWNQLMSYIHMFTCVHTVYFGTVPSSVLQALCEKMHQLEVLSAEWISDFSDEMMKTNATKLDIGKFSSLTNLRELCLRGTAGVTLPAFSLNGGLGELKALEHLKKLSLTTLKELGSDAELEFLEHLPLLTHLALGDCTSWTKQTYSIIGKLVQLQSLRLECSLDNNDIGLTDALVNLKQLESLELIQFLIPKDLHTALEKLESLKSFKVWPDTSSQSAAQVNSTALFTVRKLTFLKYFEWGVVRNKDSSLILDGDDSSKHMTDNSEEWIPFLPAADKSYCDGQTESHNEYITLSKFKDILTNLLPNTSINVLSIQSLMRIEEES